MDNSNFQTYHIAERSYVSFIKREIHNLIKPHFSEKRTGEIDIVVSELTSNLIKHAGSGDLLYKLVYEEGEPVLEILCLDNGPGIQDMAHAMTDGASTLNTLGHGLGSINRLSSFSQIYSIEDWGTIVYARLHDSEKFQQPVKKNTIVRSLKVPYPGEMVSGDGLMLRSFDDLTLIFAGDGLGHGVFAAEACTAAIDAFNSTSSSDPATILREIHLAVKKTRGLVATVAAIHHDTKKIELCGVGNISTRIQRGLEYKNYSGNNGIVGLNMPTRLENTIHDMNKLQIAIFCSDGIRSKWDLSKYPSILKYDPMIIAAALYKDHGRQTDDMSILITKAI